jgi:peptide deformylase
MFKIETWNNNPILREIAQEIDEKDYKEVIKLWKEMIKFLKDKNNGWVWLAATKIGKSIRLITVWLPKSRSEEKYKIIMMINPKIIEHSQDKEYDEEWCLSVPKTKWNVWRFKQIKISFIDENKKRKTLILEWLQARVVQHEIDHLNGVLFTDYLE